MSKIKFKNTGKLKKDFIKKEKYKETILKSKKQPIGIRLPLTPVKNKNNTLFEMTYNINDQIKINLKNLVLTRKGEYLCSPDFGTNLIDLYNRTDIENIEDNVMRDIQNAVSKYMPFVRLLNYTSKKIESTFENPEYYKINIDYQINGEETINNLIIKLLTSR